MIHLDQSMTTTTVERPDHRARHITSLNVIAQQSFLWVEDFLQHGSYRDVIPMSEFNRRVNLLTKSKCKTILDKIESNPRLICVEKYANPVSRGKIIGKVPKHKIYAIVQPKTINITKERNTCEYLTNEQFSQLRSYESETINVLTIRWVAYYAMKAYYHIF